MIRPSFFSSEVFTSNVDEVFESHANNTASSLAAVLSTILLIALIVIVAVYVICAILEMNALRAVGYKHIGFAWIPFLSVYALVDACSASTDDVMLFGKIKIPLAVFKWWIFIMMAVSFVLGFLDIPFIASLLTIICNVVTYRYFFALLDNDSEPTTKFGPAIAAVFVPFVAPILFAVYTSRRNKTSIN